MLSKEKTLYILAIFLIKISSGQKIFIHQQDVEITVPVTKEPIKNFGPLLYLKFTDAQSTSNSSYRFSLDDTPDFLTIDETSGEIFFIREKWTQTKVQHLKASVQELGTGAIAHTTITFNFLNTDKQKFCLNYSCFYDRVRFMTAEFDSGKRNKAQVIGDIISPMYHKFCDMIQPIYFLENGTDYVEMSRKDQLLKLGTLDFETIQTENISLSMSCEVKTKKDFEDLKTIKKLINVTIVDQNDNTLSVDAESVYLFREQLDFSSGDLVDRSKVIIFRDSDSLAVNDQVKFELLDKHNMFSHTCTPTSWMDNNFMTTMFVCDISFSHSGRLNLTEYCFKIRAYDSSKGKKPFSAVSHICVISKLPEESEKAVVPQYPEKIFLPQSASVLARVTQPFNSIEKGRFRLNSDFYGAFNITEKGGIIYVARANFLVYFPPASEAILEVHWMDHRYQINVTLTKGNSICNQTSVYDFCAQHETQTSCESFCSIGAVDGRCKWRSHSGSDLFSPFYATCLPELVFCGNQICDPLENLGSSIGNHICPQDCTTDVTGVVSTSSIGISGAPKGHVCTCNESEECICGSVIISNAEESTITGVMTSSTDNLEPASTYEDSSELKSFCKDSLCVTLIFGLCASITTSLLISFIIISAQRCLKNVRTFSADTLDQQHEKFIKLPAQPSMIEIINECEKNPPGNPDFYSRHWELDISKVTVERTIGEGEFGKVLLAKLVDFQGQKSTKVVIKTVKNAENETELMSLKKEFEQLQKVSIHPHSNVITLIGCYSKGPDPLIFLEFCLFESLKDYLMASRLIPIRTNIEKDVDKVTSEEILRFSLQIANGMAHLAELKLVHRDLAARNILLSEGKICKISDFGLTRNVCNSCDVYSKNSNDKVPVKWLAPESLTGNEDYSTKSDVWSFGILGYELIMLGESPYPEVAANHRDILSFLTNGNRMKRPNNCSMQLFSIFESCWQFDPSRRPSFDDLAKKFEAMIVCPAKDTLWSTPLFLLEQMQNFDLTFYQNYIARIRMSLAAAERKSQKRRRSEDDDINSEVAINSLLPIRPFYNIPKPSISMNAVDNAAYVSNDSFSRHSFKWNLKRENPMVTKTLHRSSESTINSSGFVVHHHYLPMERMISKECQTADASVETLRSSSSSGFGTMEALDPTKSKTRKESDF